MIGEKITKINNKKLQYININGNMYHMKGEKITMY